MISSKEELLLILNSDNFGYQLYEHPPVFTASDAEEHCVHIPGVHVKNLFLRNKKKTAYWLITVKDEKRVDLMAFGNILNEGRLSFASHSDLIAMLGIQPGSVTPLAIINDQAKRVKLIFDNALLLEKHINIHPMENTATISVQLCDLLRFIEGNHQGKIEFIEIPNS
ncbi:MAG TPA: prolyl-tRNA synthetase associated domain-containing protein [Gammaproteobacteria bacterium]|jgi:Ala-tRNA(Pro) deacylase|nr:prolyl-tRNA synthetase associated domain-containing protein [Gammaproteobacteria bacterium]